jgi:hypothetical protein
VIAILQRDFILGEKKYIKFRATSCDNLPVVITGAQSMNCMRMMSHSTKEAASWTEMNLWR